MRYRDLLTRGTLVAAFTLVETGCQYVGPHSIDVGRGQYNDIIQATSMEQTLSNIVRVYRHEPPMFIDVTEVDATVSFSSSNSVGGNLGFSRTVAGGNSGATKNNNLTNLRTDGASASAGLSYSESPTIRYVPLLGQALVAQMVTPVSVDALSLLYDSGWDVSALLEFSSAYLTLDPRQFDTALNTVSELNYLAAVEISATQSPLRSAEASQSSQSSGGTGDTSSKPAARQTNNDSLVFYLLPDNERGQVAMKKRILQLWIRMLRMYRENQPPFTIEKRASSNCKKIKLSLDADALRDWDVHIDKHLPDGSAGIDERIDAARNCLPNYIELRVVPILLSPAHIVPASTKKSNRSKEQTSGTTLLTTHAPQLRTFSALGILKNATELPDPRIEFVDSTTYHAIRGNSWNKDVNDLSFYMLTPDQLNSIDCSPRKEEERGCESRYPAGMSAGDAKALDSKLMDWLRGADASNHPFGTRVYEEAGTDVLDTSIADVNGRLDQLRRYLLVIVSEQPPDEPVYVSYSDGNRWYYIARDDVVSQKNFQLLSLFMSMMAVPPSTQPLSPVITVGGG